MAVPRRASCVLLAYESSRDIMCIVDVLQLVFFRLLFCLPFLVLFYVPAPK